VVGCFPEELLLWSNYAFWKWFKLNHNTSTFYLGLRVSRQRLILE